MNKIIVCLFIALNARACSGQIAGSGINGRREVTIYMSTYKFVSIPETDETNIYQKFGVNSRKQAVARARDLGFLPFD